MGIKQKKKEFRTIKSSPKCRNCGFYWDIHKKYVENACNEWVPSDNLEFLEFQYEKKNQSK